MVKIIFLSWADVSYNVGIAIMLLKDFVAYSFCRLSRISLGEQVVLSEGSKTRMQGKWKIHVWKKAVWRHCVVLSWGTPLHLNVPLLRKKVSNLATAVAIATVLLVRNKLVLVHGQLTAL